MILKEKLQNTKMNKGESVVSYLTRIGQAKDELEAIREVLDNSELVRIALNGFTK